MAYGKDICSSCGKHTDIVAKLVENVERLYCKECQDKELKMMLENFDQINFLLHKMWFFQCDKKRSKDRN